MCVWVPYNARYDTPYTSHIHVSQLSPVSKSLYGNLCVPIRHDTSNSTQSHNQTSDLKACARNSQPDLRIDKISYPQNQLRRYLKTILAEEEADN